MPTLSLIASGIVLLLAFLLIEGRFAKAPLMPLRIFRARSLSAANAILLLVGGATFGMWFFFSLYLQDVLGFSPLKAGVTFLPMTLAIVVGSMVASRITIRVGPKRLLIAGMLCLSAGLLLFSRITTSGGYVDEMLAPGLLTAFGMSFAFIPATICATSGVPGTRPDSPRRSSTPHGCSAARSASRSWRRSPRPTPTRRCTTRAPASTRTTRRSSVASRSRSWWPRGSHSSAR